MSVLADALMATLDTIWARRDLFLNVLFMDKLKSLTQKTMSQELTGRPGPLQGTDRLASYRMMLTPGEDGCLMDGESSQAYAKFALPKGLPQAEGERRLAIPNDPHFVNDYDGVIAEGYGKGEKRLLNNTVGVVKLKGETFLSKVNYHRHDADVAGEHYDLVCEGVPDGTTEFELNIPRGEGKGRYAFIATNKGETDQGVLCLRMKDRSVLYPKPSYKLKETSSLIDVVQNPYDYMVERKLDGSLVNIHVHHDRAIMRSHRESAEPYYDKLPDSEFLWNKSRLWTCRYFFTGPDLDGTEFQAEAVHCDGAARVSGILNALPENARKVQQQHGPVQIHVWDIKKYKGQDVSHLPYGERRALYEQAVRDIRCFNKNWHAIESLEQDLNALAPLVYDEWTHDKRGLPWSEGVVIKRVDGTHDDTWIKIKTRDTYDLTVVEILPGTGKYADTVGVIVVEEPNSGARSEVGSFRISDAQRDLMWQYREQLTGQVAEIDAFEITERGAVRAGSFVRWHPSKSEGALFITADTLAGGDEELAEEIKYRLINSHG